MSTLTAANPVSEGVMTVLQDATLQAAVDGRVFSDLPPNTPRPCVLAQIINETDIRGLGAGGMPEIDLRTHAFSDVETGSLMEAQDINLMMVALLKDAAITATGYTQAGRVVYRNSRTLPVQELFGVKVHEVVSDFTIWMEE